MTMPFQCVCLCFGGWILDNFSSLHSFYKISWSLLSSKKKKKEKKSRHKSVVFRGGGGGKRERQVKFSKYCLLSPAGMSGVWKELESVTAVKLLVLGRCVGVGILFTEAETLGCRILRSGTEVN